MSATQGLRAFVSFCFVFIVNLKGSKAHYCKLYLLNIIKKTFACVNVWMTLTPFWQRVRGRLATKHHILRRCLEGLSIPDLIRWYVCHHSQRFDTSSHFSILFYLLTQISMLTFAKLKNKPLICWLFIFGQFFSYIYIYILNLE